MATPLTSDWENEIKMQRRLKKLTRVLTVKFKAVDMIGRKFRGPCNFNTKRFIDRSLNVPTAKNVYTRGVI